MPELWKSQVIRRCQGRKNSLGTGKFEVLSWEFSVVAFLFFIREYSYLPHALIRVAVCLLVILTCPPTSSTLAQTYEQLAVPHAVPSPSGNAIILKQYPPDRLDYHMSLRVRKHFWDIVDWPLLSGLYEGQAGQDGVVVGWHGDGEVIVGSPTGLPMVSGPREVDGIALNYIDYERDLSKSKFLHSDKVILKKLVYSAEEAETAFHGVLCAIELKGTDGKYFDRVSVRVFANGVGIKRPTDPALLGAASASVRFSLTRLTASNSPPLTPTQANFDNFSFYGSRSSLDTGPMQDGMSLTYSWLDMESTSEIFRLLRNGNYLLRFSMTFGRQEIEYLVQDGISNAVAADFQRCEARTNIFHNLIGSALTSQQ